MTDDAIKRAAEVAAEYAAKFYLTNPDAHWTRARREAVAHALATVSADPTTKARCIQFLREYADDPNAEWTDDQRLAIRLAAQTFEQFSADPSPAERRVTLYAGCDRYGQPSFYTDDQCANKVTDPGDWAGIVHDGLGIMVGSVVRVIVVPLQAESARGGSDE